MGTSSWKTYQDPLKTYTLKYPESWIIISERINSQPSNLVLQTSDFITAEPAMGGGFIPGGAQGIKFELAQGTNSNFANYEQLKEFYETKYTGYPLNFFQSRKEVQIDNVSAMLWLGGKPEYGGSLDHAYFINKGLIYEITFTSAINENVLFQQIISTLKFTQ